MIQTLNHPYLRAALEKNIIGRFSYVQSQHVAMEIQKDENIILINSNQMTDMFNMICCAGNASKEKIIQFIQYFQEKRLPFAVWQGFENENPEFISIMKNHGIKKIEEELAMAASLESLPSVNKAGDLSIQQVDNPNKLNDFIHVLVQLVPHEKNAITQFFLMAEKILLEKNAKLKLFVGYLKDKPISTCSAFFSEEVVGIFDIIALPEVRGMGIGSKMTVKAMQTGAENHYKVAVLTATNDAKFLYEKLGFQAVNSMAVYGFA